MNITRKKKLRVLYNHRYFYLLLVPAFLYYILFCFLPMSGLVLAFKKFQYGYLDNILSLFKMWTFPNIGLENFIAVFRSAIFRQVIGNTVVISISRIIIEFPVPVVLAILLNEVRHSHLKRCMQTVYTFPHFLSWVVVVVILNGIFRGDGVINKVIVATGANGVNFLSNPKTFRALLYATSIWKEAAGAPLSTSPRCRASIPSCMRLLWSMEPTGGKTSGILPGREYVPPWSLCLFLRFQIF